MSGRDTVNDTTAPKTGDGFSDGGWNGGHGTSTSTSTPTLTLDEHVIRNHFREARSPQRARILECLVDEFRASDVRVVSRRLWPDGGGTDPTHPMDTTDTTDTMETMDTSDAHLCDTRAETRPEMGSRRYASDSSFTSSTFTSTTFTTTTTDMIRILPSEVIDMILAYVAPEDLFRLRIVSRRWNAYLCREDLLRSIDCTMAPFFNLETGWSTPWTAQANLAEKTRNRCALLNGAAYSSATYKLAGPFDPHGQRAARAWTREPMAYRHGTFIIRTGVCVEVLNLYTHPPTRFRLVGDDLERFEHCAFAGDLIYACTFDRRVYLWRTNGGGDGSGSGGGGGGGPERVASFMVPEPVMPLGHIHGSIMLRGQPGTKYVYDTHCRELMMLPDAWTELDINTFEGDGCSYRVLFDGDIKSHRVCIHELGATQASERHIHVQTILDSIISPSARSAYAAHDVTVSYYNNHKYLQTRCIRAGAQDAGKLHAFVVLVGGWYRVCHVLHHGTGPSVVAQEFPMLGVTFDTHTQPIHHCRVVPGPIAAAGSHIDDGFANLDGAPDRARPIAEKRRPMTVGKVYDDHNEADGNKGNTMSDITDYKIYNPAWFSDEQFLIAVDQGDFTMKVWRFYRMQQDRSSTFVKQ